jgi:hypothetical protein
MVSIPPVGKKPVPTQPIPVKVNGYTLYLFPTTPGRALESIKAALIRFFSNLNREFAKGGGREEVCHTPDDCPGLTIQAKKMGVLVRIVAFYDGNIIANEVFKLS